MRGRVHMERMMKFAELKFVVGGSVLEVVH